MYLKSFTEAGNFNEHFISTAFDWNHATILNCSDFHLFHSAYMRSVDSINIPQDHLHQRVHLLH